MDRKELEYILELELFNIKNSLGEEYCDKVKEYLIKPEMKKLLVPLSKEIEEHWVVFDEDISSEQTGYLIFYAEEYQSFGIGTKSNMDKIPGLGTFIGIYGSFLNTLKSL